MTPTRIRQTLSEQRSMPLCGTRNDDWAAREGAEKETESR